MKILFHENQIGERGTTVALHDYAYYVRYFYGIEPIICFNRYAEHNKQVAIDRFKKEFDVVSYENFSEVEKIIEKNDCDYFYAIKYGNLDGVLVSNSKNLIHSVYCADISQVHGHKYATVSEWQSSLTSYKIPYVPHMVNLPDHELNLRNELNIPDDHMVFGRHGGYDTFDVPFINQSIFDLLNKRNDCWFIFLNTPNVINHPHCLYFDVNVDLNYKVKFINTCDAMIHGGFRGETFGISILEFAARNKQIIAFDNYVGGRNHHLYLKDNYHMYSNKEELDRLFNNIEKNNPFNTMYLNEMFSPKVVIQKFKEVFLT